MHKILLVLIIMFFVSSATVFADTLNAEMISFIHLKTKNTVSSLCKRKITKLSDAACNCVGEKAEESLDDDALSKCSSDEGGTACTVQAVRQAITIALSNASLAACAARESQGPLTAPAATTTGVNSQSMNN